jgi:hypothetical protein
MQIKYLLNWILFFLFCIPVYSQKDTTKKQTIDIISSFKPEIRNFPKLNFSAAYLIADSTKNLAPYTIPSYNLFFSYQPVSLKPLALTIDSVLQLGTRNYLKLGYGNLSSPFAAANLNFGNGINSLFNLSANYFSAKGAIQHQEYSQFKSKFSGSYFTPSNEVFGNLGLTIQDNYLYGYDHSLYNYKKQDLLQNFNDFNASIGIRNKVVNDWGINYSPFIQFSIFDNYLKLKENSFKFDIPVEKSLSDIYSIKLSVKADINSYTSKNSIDNIQFNNTLFQLSPEFIFKNNLYSLHGGLNPSWDDGQFVLLPNFYGQGILNNFPLLLQAGYTGQLISNSFRNLSLFNPYLSPLLRQQNTREKELYVGFKSSSGSHISFSAKFSYLQYNNLPLFINDTASDYKSFLINSASEISNFRIHADVSYLSSDQFTLSSGITYNGYQDLKNNQKPWGIIPFEWINSIRWQASNKLLVKSASKFFTGAPFVLKNNVEKSLSNGFDLSVGAEYSINKRFSAWIDVNNILNNKYARWYNYQVYGINLLGGFIIKI